MHRRSVGLYSGEMIRPSKHTVRAILLGLMLIVGSVQADVTYFCDMMNTAMHDDDCCCADADVDHMMLDDNQPCCEKSVDLLVDTITGQAPVAAQVAKFESDADPPDVFDFVFSINSLFPVTSVAFQSNSEEFLRVDGSAIYLTTLRLRI
jgi:hypothetical protein